MNANPKPTRALIREIREAAGLTQTQAGELVHSTLRSWQKWELGERRMHPAFWELFLIKSDPAVKKQRRRTIAGKLQAVLDGLDPDEVVSSSSEQLAARISSLKAKHAKG